MGRLALVDSWCVQFPLLNLTYRTFIVAKLSTLNNYLCFAFVFASRFCVQLLFLPIVHTQVKGKLLRDSRLFITILNIYAEVGPCAVRQYGLDCQPRLKLRTVLGPGWDGTYYRCSNLRTPSSPAQNVYLMLNGHCHFGSRFLLPGAHANSFGLQCRFP